MFWWPKKHKKVVQLLPSFAENDAVSEQVVKMNKALEAEGCYTKIYTNHFPKKYKGTIGEAKFLNSNKFDLAIYHHSIGDPISKIVQNLNIPLVFYYHNITPPEYFEGYNSRVTNLLMDGKKQLLKLKSKPVISFAASEFNANELREIGYENVHVLPIFFDSERLEKLKTNKKLEKELNSEFVTNILFVGRVVPNKCHKDLIKAFYIYNKYFNQISRLNIVGSYVEMDNYKAELEELIDALDLKEKVIIRGKVSEKDWATYYQNSDLFLGLSEHEGFFVPALEANYYNLPIVAYNAGAVKDTVGKSGLVLDSKKPEQVAEAINMVVDNKEFRQKLIDEAKPNLERFTNTNPEEQFINDVKKFL